jgi:hypothetical protein
MVPTVFYVAEKEHVKGFARYYVSQGCVFCRYRNATQNILIEETMRSIAGITDSGIDATL